MEQMKKKVSSYSMWQEPLLTFAEHRVVPALLKGVSKSKNITE